MTFEELKFEIIDRQRKTEIDKLFHLYVKAETYNDLLKVIKSSGNFRWILNNGFRDLIQYFPTEELENENIYSRSVELVDQNSDIIILSGILTLRQSGKNRCRIITDGAQANIELLDMAMVEVESYERGYVIVNNSNFAYAYITARNYSSVNLVGNNNSTFYINAWGDTNVDAVLQTNSYIYYKLNDDAKINITNAEIPE